MMFLKIRKRYLFYALALASSAIASISAGVDVIAIRKYGEVYEEAPLLYGFSVFLVGFIITLLFCLILSIPYRGRSLGSLLDPAFKHLRFVRREEIAYHLLAGLGNAITTTGYFFVLTVMPDPSAVLPFYQTVILYLLLVEVIAEKNAPTLIEIQSSAIVTFGAILGSLSFKGEIDLSALAIVFLVVNPGWVLLSIYQRKLKLLKIRGEPNDSLNIRFWNILFSLAFMIIIMLILGQFFKKPLLAMGIESSMNFFWLVSIVATLAFFSYIFHIRALGIGKASVTQAVKATTIVFAIPVTFILSLFIPIPFPTTPTLWLTRSIGFILVILGIISFAITQVRAYIFIRAAPGVRVAKLIEEIWKIKGVDSVSAVSGTYDVIARVTTRTLLKGYERIVKRLESIPGIKEFRWNSILKEWENV